MLTISEVDHVIMVLNQQPWSFAALRRTEIDVHFETLRHSNPALWNGRVLLFRDCMLADRSLRGSAFETDYASFVAWRAWEGSDRSVRNCFAPIAVEGSDGGFLLGVMSRQTANAGQIYFPCGTPEPADVADGHVSFAQNAHRELLEETGIDSRSLQAVGGWTIVEAGCFIAIVRHMRAAQTSEELREQALRHIASQSEPELSDIVIIRRREQIVPAMPPVFAAFLNQVL